MSSKANKSGHLLPLLAVTVFLLSFAVVNHQTSTDNNPQGIVLSSRDEIKDKEEKTREEVKNQAENKAEKDKSNAERNREEEKKRLEIKIKEKEVNAEALKQREQEKNRSNDGDDANEDSEFEVEVNDVKATTNFPLKLNTRTNELSIVTGENETRKVVILPDQAVENLTKNKKIELINDVELVENSETGEVEYRASGVETKKLLGLFKVQFKKEYQISSLDGSVEEKPVTGFMKLLDLLSN